MLEDLSQRIPVTAIKVLRLRHGAPPDLTLWAGTDHEARRPTTPAAHGR
jgi:hypothetical protein